MSEAKLSYGWDGEAWRKLPMLWGYSGRWVENVEFHASGAGNAVVSTTTVGAGYIRVLQALSIYHDAGVNKPIVAYAHDGTIACELLVEVTAATGTTFTWSGEVVLKENDFIRAIAFAPGDGKKVYLNVWGYEMKIAE